MYHRRSGRLWLRRGRLARRSSGEASRLGARSGQSSGRGRLPGSGNSGGPGCDQSRHPCDPCECWTREDMSWVSAAGMRFLGTPSVDSSVNSPVPSPGGCSGGMGRRCLTTAQPWSSIADVTLVEGFIPVLAAELDLHLRGERVGRAAAWGSAVDRTVLARGATGLWWHGPRLPGPVTRRPACRHQGDPGRTG